MDDKFIKGLTAGIAAGLATSILNLAAFYLNFSTLRYLDFSSVLIYGQKPNSTLGSLFAWFGMLMFQALLGIIFAYLSPLIRTKYFFVKGWFYGVLVWFAAYAVTILFDVPELRIIPLKTAVSNFLGASIFGLFLAYSLRWLGKRAKYKS